MYIANGIHVLTLAEYNHMWDLINAWHKQTGIKTMPNYVDLGVTDTTSGKSVNLRITSAQITDMYNRMKSYMDGHGGVKANIIGVEGPIGGKVVPPLLQKVFDAVGGTFTSLTQFMNYIINVGVYSYYYDDKYTQASEISRILKRQGLNCTDFSQLGMAVAGLLNQWLGKGYTADYVHVFCKKASTGKYELGHILLRVKGGEFGSNFVYYDLAEAAEGKKGVGHIMCSLGYKVNSYNDAWLAKEFAPVRP